MMTVFYDFRCLVCGKDTERSYFDGICQPCAMDAQDAKNAKKSATLTDIFEKAVIHTGPSQLVGGVTKTRNDRGSDDPYGHGQ